MKNLHLLIPQIFGFDETLNIEVPFRHFILIVWDAGIVDLSDVFNLIIY